MSAAEPMWVAEGGGGAEAGEDGGRGGHGSLRGGQEGIPDAPSGAVREDEVRPSQCFEDASPPQSITALRVQRLGFGSGFRF
jgi:hypothetical protein